MTKLALRGLLTRKLRSVLTGFAVVIGVAFVVGTLAEHQFARRYLSSVAAMLAGLAIIYAFGTVWLAWFATLQSGSAAVGLTTALATGVYPFVVADLVKLAAAAGITPGLWRVIGAR